MSTAEQRKREKEKKRKSAFEHYIEAVMRETMRKTIDQSLKEIFKGFK